ncbi:aspartic and glutamic acid-rich protein-like [Littorina saxatilis]|uniref:EF-hand domain-containing protein n=1 Tax=Littorina saxatilis TaxID=31220 RepID=A0AAN9B9V5_9CAEN
MTTSTSKKAAVIFLALTTLATYINAAAIPQFNPEAENELDSLKNQPSLGSEDSLEEALQSPQAVPDSSEKYPLDVVRDDTNLETIEHLDEDTAGDDEDNKNDDEGEDDVDDEDPEEQLEDLRPDDLGRNHALPNQPEETSDDELQAEEIQANEHHDDGISKNKDSDREYEKALQDMKNGEEIGPDFQEQAIENESQTGSEENSSPEKDYEGYGSDDEDADGEDEKDEDDFIEITDLSIPAKDPSTVNSDDDKAFQNSPEAQIPPTNERGTPAMPASLSEAENVESQHPYGDDAIVSEDDVMHDDVKRADKMLKLPGHPPMRVIELNETLYLNNTDDREPKFQPVRIPDKFEDYDLNKDGLISLPEMRYVTGAVEGAKDAFRDADRDGDGWVEREEFDLAGWGLPANPTPTPPPRRRVVFVPREELHPSSIPRGAEEVSSRRQYGRRRH